MKASEILNIEYLEPEKGHKIYYIIENLHEVNCFKTKKEAQDVIDLWDSAEDLKRENELLKSQLNAESDVLALYRDENERLKKTLRSALKDSTIILSEIKKLDNEKHKRNSGY